MCITICGKFSPDESTAMDHLNRFLVIF
ncbi:MAG: hypothetical protein ACLR4F_12710 [Ruminococcus sp.]